MARTMKYRTKTRTAIFEFLNEKGDRRFTILEIQDYLNSTIGGVSKTTVYRNLNSLCKEGLVFKYMVKTSDAWYYEYSGVYKDCSKNVRGKCSKCGKIFHIDGEYAKDFEKLIDKTYGLKVDPSKTIIVGVCKDCINLFGVSDTITRLKAI